jgi:hypothetical protein
MDIVVTSNRAAVLCADDFEARVLALLEVAHGEHPLVEWQARGIADHRDFALGISNDIFVAHGGVRSPPGAHLT